MMSRRTALASALASRAPSAHAMLRRVPKPAGGGAAPIVNTATGTIRGGVEGSVFSFLGVPYASAPVGALRFRSPQPAKPWTGVRDATAVGPDFLQLFYSGTTREDALTLNVWTPAVEGKAPVVLYIHGGGWMVGSGSLPIYRSVHLAQRADCVVVTFN